MKSDQIYHKTTKGQAEIDAEVATLSMKERRVLILINGEKDSDKLRKLSRCDNIQEILTTLYQQGFIEQSQGFIQSGEDDSDFTSAEYEPTELTQDMNAAPGVGAAASEFMCNTLLTFANRVRVSKLIDEINSATTLAQLKDLVKPWYQAISETPGGMYQADELRQEVLVLIDTETADGS